MALRIDKVDALSTGKSKDVPVGCRRFILCNSGEETVYFRPADGKKATAANGFPLKPGEKTEVMIADELSLFSEDKGEVRMLYVREE